MFLATGDYLEAVEDLQPLCLDRAVLKTRVAHADGSHIVQHSFEPASYFDSETLKESGMCARRPTITITSFVREKRLTQEQEQVLVADEILDH